MLADALDEFITVDDACNIYGVVIDPESMEIDRQATDNWRL